MEKLRLIWILAYPKILHYQHKSKNCNQTFFLNIKEITGKGVSTLIPPHRVIPRSLSPQYTYLIFFLDCCYNRNGRKCRRHEHTAPSDPWELRSRAKLERTALKGFLLKKNTLGIIVRRNKCHIFQELFVKDDISKNNYET